MEKLVEVEKVIADRATSAKKLVVSEIVRAMKSRKMSNAELARRIGVSTQYVGQMLGHKRNMTIETLEEIAHHLGMAWCWKMVNMEIYPLFAASMAIAEKNFRKGVDTSPVTP